MEVARAWGWCCRAAIAVLFVGAALFVDPRAAAACKGIGDACKVSASCCARNCQTQPGERFGICCRPGDVLSNGTCCTPTSCTAEGANCGTISDGCGGILDCGSCNAPETCGGGGVDNVCAVPPCGDAAYPTCGGACPEGEVCHPYKILIGSLEGPGDCACGSPTAPCFCAFLATPGYVCPDGQVCRFDLGSGTTCDQATCVAP